jgi:transglutaminase-like putative cysteine protease
MRIRIQHRTRYTYDQPVQAVLQVLRMTPSAYEGQKVRDWHVEIDHDAALRVGEDAFGNITHTVSVPGPVPSLTISLEGEVDTIDTHGIIRETAERFPVRMYLRQTPLTTPDQALAEYAAAVTKGMANPLDKLHGLMAAIHRDMVFDVHPTNATTSATEAFTLKRGVCQDLSHVFIVCARLLDIPARYIGGHLYRSDGAADQEAGHAWAEAHVAGLGWIGFDPTNGICVTDAHVRVCAALDYLGAAPIRGTRRGGNSEEMIVDVRVEQAEQQRQE